MLVAIPRVGTSAPLFYANPAVCDAKKLCDLAELYFAKHLQEVKRTALSFGVKAELAERPVVDLLKLMSSFSRLINHEKLALKQSLHTVFKVKSWGVFNYLNHLS
jgi:hypothetical protein